MGPSESTLEFIKTKLDRIDNQLKTFNDAMDEINQKIANLISARAIMKEQISDLQIKLDDAMNLINAPPKIRESWY